MKANPPASTSYSRTPEAIDVVTFSDQQKSFAFASRYVVSLVWTINLLQVQQAGVSVAKKCFLVTLSVLVGAFAFSACGSAGNSSDSSSTSSTISLEQLQRESVQVDRDACVVTLTGAFNPAIEALAKSSAESDRAWREATFRLGASTPEFRIFQDVTSRTLDELPRIGIAKTEEKARAQFVEECATLHPLRTTTTTASANVTNSLPPLKQPGEIVGIASAPATVGECIGLISGLKAVECTVGAWRSSKISGANWSFLSKSAQNALVQAPPPATIQPGKCTVISSNRVQHQYEYEDNIVFDCKFDLDGNRTLTLVIDEGTVGQSALITSAAIATK